MVSVLTSTHVLINGETIPATIFYNDKIIDIVSERLSEKDAKLRNSNVKSFQDVTPYLIMPGLVDSHVHLNEPGRTEWEGFSSGTKSAAYGGVTTLIDMPLNAIPPTTTPENFITKINAAKDQCFVNVGFWGGLIPDNLDDLIPLVSMGVRGFKGFLCPSGVDEFPNITPAYILKAMQILKGQHTMLMFHAEMESPEVDIKGDGEASSSSSTPSSHSCCSSSSFDPRSYDSFLSSRPDAFELTAIGEIIKCCTKFPEIPVHIVHLATHQAIPMLIEAKSRGIPITAETCFHYLSLSAENIKSGSTHFKCVPPIRTDENRKLLWDALRKDVITSVVSDHSPCTPELKGLERGDFFEAWGGISSVGLGLSILYTEGQKLTPKISFQEINKWCSINTAKQVGLEKSKGQFKIGYDSDILIFNPEAKYILRSDRLYFKNKLTAYEGLEFKGEVTQTIVGGKVVFTKENGVGEEPLGKLILEPRQS